jgi:hypothetical protein
MTSEPPPQDFAPDEVELERLRRSVWVEAVAGLAVLVLSAVLVGQPRGSDVRVTSATPQRQAAQVGVPQSWAWRFDR